MLPQIAKGRSIQYNETPEEFLESDFVTLVMSKRYDVVFKNLLEGNITECLAYKEFNIITNKTVQFLYMHHTWS